MFIIIVPTNAHVISIRLILQLLRYVSVFVHHPQGAYKLCQLIINNNSQLIRDFNYTILRELTSCAS